MSAAKPHPLRALPAALSVVGLGAVALWQALLIPASPIGDGIGSAAFPVAISLGVLGCGAVLTAQALRGGWDCLASDPAEPAPELRPVAWIVLAFVLAGASLLFTGSFILAATLLFVVSVHAFMPGKLRTAVPLGLGAAVLTYLVFAGLLGLEIGQGFPERTLRWILRF
ncbi:MAG: hypothetical protein DI629_10040 [Mesorhizobium amorphae]|nr:MAG: hypothetical protein DI629_10040 [Mesorhizobium amorphae]